MGCIAAMHLRQVDVSGWTVVRADKGVEDGWKIPAGVKVPAAGLLMILCPKNKRKFNRATS